MLKNNYRVGLFVVLASVSCVASDGDRAASRALFWQLLDDDAGQDGAKPEKVEQKKSEKKQHAASVAIEKEVDEDVPYLWVQTLKGHRNSVMQLVFESNTVLVSHALTSKRKWDLATGTCTERTEAQHRGIRKFLQLPLSQEVSIRVPRWTGEISLVGKGFQIPFQAHDVEVTALALSSDKQKLATADKNGVINVWTLNAAFREKWLKKVENA